MALKITTPPAADKIVVSIAEFREQSGQDGISADDALVKRLIAAVTSWLAGPDGWLGRSLVTQALTLTVPLGVAGYHPGDTRPVSDPGIYGLVLPRPPFIDVVSVAVIDAAGSATAIPASAYATTDDADGMTRLAFTPDYRAPLLPAGPASLRVNYRAGYGEPADVDPGIRHAILMAVMRLYAGRGDPTISLQTDPMMAEMFRPFRIWTTL